MTTKRKGNDQTECYGCLMAKLEDLQQRINKANAKLHNMFDLGNEKTIIDDLLELLKILEIENIDIDEFIGLKDILRNEELNEYTKRLEHENKELKKQLKIKHDGFMASVDESCDLAKENTNLQQALNEIREYCNYNDEQLYEYNPDYNYEEELVKNYDNSSFREDILEIIDKSLGDDEK